MRWRNAALVGLLATVIVGWKSALSETNRGPSDTVVLIGLDAFRWDYIDRPAAVNLRRLAARGSRAERLVPAFPTKTYPNFYTLVTGLTTEHHGIVANTMHDSAYGWFRTGNDPAVRDSRWFGGEPIWVTAEKAGLKTAIYFWPGDESEIKGVRPTWFAGYHGAVSRADRVHRVLEWLGMPAATRPRLVTVYFEDVDGASHDAGPAGARTDSAIARVDSAVGAIVDGIERLGRTGEVDVVVVSDHGMAPSGPDRVIALDDFVSLDSVEVIDWNPVAMIRPRAGKMEYAYRRLRGAHPNLQVYRKAEVPARFRFSNSSRITPIVAIADEGWTITSRRQLAADPKVSLGTHGYDNALLSMGATLIAAGPHVRSGAVLPPLGNVHVYPLLAALLGVTPAPTDGATDSIRAMLRP
jgi:predicted AlkP superfamily pyrophosphatase or phosphodiesterase